VPKFCEGTCSSSGNRMTASAIHWQALNEI
jgi:hypothetical protein